jgi:hypothetical protein
MATGGFVGGMSRDSCRDVEFPRRSKIGNVGEVGAGATITRVVSSVRGECSGSDTGDARARMAR